MPTQLRSNPTDEEVIIELYGNFDESVTFPKDKFRLSQRIIFDCGGVEHINSHSIQTWMIWMRQFDSRQQFVFKNVPQRVVDIINMVDEFLPPESTVESFFIPYECEKCAHEEFILVHRGKEFIERTVKSKAKMMFTKELNCPKCKSAMKISVIEKKYFQFLNQPSRSNQKEY
jgi:hypothetical protein